MSNSKTKLYELPLFTVDAFCNVPFAGNPAAVCLVSCEGVSDEYMQNLASEMNISETAFVSRLRTEDTFQTASKFGLRWFTPTNEVPLCGHATLASAAVLFYCLNNPSDSITFQTLSGDLIARKDPDNDLVVLDLPQAQKFEKMDPKEIEKLVQCTVDELPVNDVVLAADRAKLLVRLDDAVTRQQLEDMCPVINLMIAAHDVGTIKGVIVTVKGSKDNGSIDSNGEVYDFISRYFAPWNGIPEDPVTGSAHTVLGPYWAKDLDKTQLYARQCSKRGGELYVKVLDNGRVDVAGHATVVVQGTVSLHK